MKKKIISIILALSVSITMIRVNTIRSSAFDPTIISDLLRAIGLVTAGAVAGGAAMGLGDCLAEAIDGGLDTWYSETLPNKVTTSANNVFNSNGITVVSTNTGYYAKANESLSGDELEFATILAEKLNNHPMFQTIVTGVSEVTGGSLGMGIKEAAYADLKIIIGQATAEFTQHKAIEYAKETGLTLISNGALPVYDFSFVGPSPTLQFGSYTTNNTSYKFGDLDLLPLCYSKGNNSQYIFDEDYIKSSGFVYHGASRYTAPHTNYGCWILFNGKLYVSKVIWATSDSGYISSPSAIHDGNSYFATDDGTKLNENPDYYSTVFCDYPVGLYSTDGYKEFTLPVLPSSNEIDGDPFTTTITPGSVEIPRTEGEQAVIDGINLGLISDNPDLTIDENGNIVKIDGIDTTKLMELLQTIANNGTISFDSVEEYLQTITQLIRVSNTDTKTMNTVIANLNELTKAQNADIAAINANVASIAQALAISDTATADNTFDVDTPSTIIDKFPFCLPFDIQRVFNLLSAEPKAPSYDIPITMEGVFDFHISGDLSEYEWIAEIVRWVLYIVFIIGLIMITNKLIGRG